MSIGDRLMLRSAGLDPAALTFAFRPLWQLDTTSAAAIALQKAQATQIYAGLGRGPAAVTARLVEAQLVQDGTYPNAAAVFAEGDGAHALTDSRGRTEVSNATGGFGPRAASLVIGMVDGPEAQAWPRMDITSRLPLRRRIPWLVEIRIYKKL